MMERRAARPVLVSQGRVFQEIQLGLYADLSKVADYRLGVRPFAIGIDVDRKAVRIAGLGQQLLGLFCIIFILGNVVRAADLGREAGGVDHARPFADQVVDDGLTVDGVCDSLAHLKILHGSLAGSAGGIEAEVADTHGLTGN